MLGVYVHVPFCSAICNYCNFNRGLFDAALKTRYVDALVVDIATAGLKACTTDDASAAVVRPFRAAAESPDDGSAPVVQPFRAAADSPDDGSAPVVQAFRAAADSPDDGSAPVVQAFRPAADSPDDGSAAVVQAFRAAAESPDDGSAPVVQAFRAAADSPDDGSAAVVRPFRAAADSPDDGSAPVVQAFRAAADTIYFGGGTPSLLEPHEIARIIAACEQAFDLAADREVTLEANPETVTVERLAGYRAAGVNRISFGVQSFRDEELRRLSRIHDAARARAAVADARTAGFDNVSIDLMMWLPEQRLEHWLASVDAAIDTAPDHLSLYLLEVYPNAPLKDDMARARWSQAPDEDAAAMYVGALERLEGAGYEQYEISNVARPGRRSRHNLKYWTDGEWAAVGCGAHGTRAGLRYRNVTSTEEYVRCIESGHSVTADMHRLTPDERLGDALFTGLRLNEGVDLARVGTRYGVDVWSRFGADLAPFVDAGCLVHEGGRLRLTREGMLLANEVMAVFV